MASSVFSDAYASLTSTLVAARRDAGLTQVEVAVQLGKPQSYVSKYESGERRLDVVEFCTIATALRLSPVELLQKFLAKDPEVS